MLAASADEAYELGMENGRVKAAKQRDPSEFPYFFLEGKTESLAALATRNFTTCLAGILIASPVAGLRPIRAFRLTFTSFPRPGITN